MVGNRRLCLVVFRTTTMDSSELYHVKQQFILGIFESELLSCTELYVHLGAYKTLATLTLPDPNSPEYTPTLLYQARAHIALNDPRSALQLIPADSENVAVKATASLAKYVAASESTEKEASLEELRDLAVEIEEDDVEGSDRDKALVRVLAGAAFTRAGEVEEALETLGVDTEDLEA